MSKKIEVSERKMTTTSGLNALAEVVEKLESKMTGDLQNFKSKTAFFCKVEEDNGLMQSDFNYTSWTLTEGRFAYQNGYIRIVLDDDCHKTVYLETGKGYTGNSKYDERIAKIDFAAAVTSLEELVSEYNTHSEAKDAELQRFLDLCKNY
jgi:hypothetical protein